MAQRVALWLSCSTLSTLPLSQPAPKHCITRPHVTLVSAPLAYPSELETLISAVKALSADLKFENLSVQPPIGSNVAPVLSEDKASIYIPLAANVELENLHELAYKLVDADVPWELKLVLAQGKGCEELFEQLKKDQAKYTNKVTLDTIEVAVSGCCNKCHKTVQVGYNPMGTAWFYRSSMFIGGKWVAPHKSEDRYPVYDPATGKQFHSIPSAGKEEVDSAVKAAKDAFEGWKNLTAEARAGYLVAIADVIERRKDELARLETLDNGKPLKESLADMSDVVDCFRYYAKLCLSVNEHSEGSPVTLPSASFQSFVRQEPIGVCALISSFNYPLLIATWKVAPCLAAGSVCVLKPSEYTSLTCLELGAIAVEVGLPAGVLNVVTGPGRTTGQYLIENPLVDKVSFTGSMATGSHIMSVGAKNITNTTLELGGKSPLIICKDVDLDKICDWLLIGIFFNSGQVCSATSRILCHKSLYPKLLDKLASEGKRLMVGSGLDEETQMGPLVSFSQQRKVLDYIASGKTEGAKLICGGSTDPRALGTGYFVEPTVFADVKPWMKIWKEEIFGPVLSVASFETEAEAIFLANDSQYGLAGAVFSADQDTCKRIARALRCGIVWINCSQPTFVQAPWGGMKRSGIGRELGPWGLQNYLQTKQVTQWVDQSASSWDWYQASKL